MKKYMILGICFVIGLQLIGCQSGAGPIDTTKAKNAVAETIYEIETSSSEPTNETEATSSEPTYETETKSVESIESTNQEKDGTYLIQIVVGSEVFEVQLYENEATKGLLSKLPMTVTMNELNGNEKYYNMDSNLPIDSSRPDTINSGDFMLYGSDCLVLFYQNFSSSYSYTSLGFVKNPVGLEAALGSGSVTVTFQTK